MLKKVILTILLASSIAPTIGCNGADLSLRIASTCIGLVTAATAYESVQEIRTQLKADQRSKNLLQALGETIATGLHSGLFLANATATLACAIQASTGTHIFGKK